MWLHLNAEKKKPYMKGRQENAKTAKVTCVPLKSPSETDIEAYKAQGGRGRGRGRGRGANQGESLAGAAAISHADFYDTHLHH